MGTTLPIQFSESWASLLDATLDIMTAPLAASPAQQPVTGPLRQLMLLSTTACRIGLFDAPGACQNLARVTTLTSATGLLAATIVTAVASLGIKCPTVQAHMLSKAPRLKLARALYRARFVLHLQLTPPVHV